MHKLVAALVPAAAAWSLCGASTLAETQLARSLVSLSKAAFFRSNGAIVLTGGMGGGMTGGGMAGGGMTGGGMAGGGMTGGGMAGAGMTGGGMAGAGMTGGGMTGGMTSGPKSGFGAAGDAAQFGNSAQSAYYTYQCVTPAVQCSFVAPASLRSTSLRAGAGCSCSGTPNEGRVR